MSLLDCTQLHMKPQKGLYNKLCEHSSASTHQDL